MSVFEAVAELHRDLEVVHGSVTHVSTDLGYLEPVDMAHALRGTSDGLVNGIVDTHLGGSDDLGESVCAIHVAPLSIPDHSGLAEQDMAEGHNLGRWVRLKSWRWVVGKDSSDVFTITEAQRGLSVEQTGRTRRYLISMGIRTACVILAIFVPGWPRWVFITGAVVLPYLAVVIANAGRENDEPGETGVDHYEARALGMSTTMLPGPEGNVYRAP